jgi:hypothetical protein
MTRWFAFSMVCVFSYFVIAMTFQANANTKYTIIEIIPPQTFLLGYHAVSAIAVNDLGQIAGQYATRISNKSVYKTFVTGPRAYGELRLTPAFAGSDRAGLIGIDAEGVVFWGVDGKIFQSTPDGSAVHQLQIIGNVFAVSHPAISRWWAATIYRAGGSFTAIVDIKTKAATELVVPTNYRYSYASGITTGGKVLLEAFNPAPDKSRELFMTGPNGREPYVDISAACASFGLNDTIWMMNANRVFITVRPLPGQPAAPVGQGLVGRIDVQGTCQVSPLSLVNDPNQNWTPLAINDNGMILGQYNDGHAWHGVISADSGRGDDFRNLILPGWEDVTIFPTTMSNTGIIAGILSRPYTFPNGVERTEDRTFFVAIPIASPNVQ